MTMVVVMHVHMRRRGRRFRAGGRRRRRIGRLRGSADGDHRRSTSRKDHAEFHRLTPLVSHGADRRAPLLPVSPRSRRGQFSGQTQDKRGPPAGDPVRTILAAGATGRRTSLVRRTGGRRRRAGAHAAVRNAHGRAGAGRTCAHRAAARRHRRIGGTRRTVHRAGSGTSAHRARAGRAGATRTRGLRSSRSIDQCRRGNQKDLHNSYCIYELATMLRGRCSTLRIEWAGAFQVAHPIVLRRRFAPCYRRALTDGACR